MLFMDTELKDFILFCVERRGQKWPALYDEMTSVANRGLFKGMGYDELKERGLSLSISNIDNVLELIEQATGDRIERYK